jgi:hypothetical protein
MALVAIAALINASVALAAGATTTIQDLSGTFFNPCNGELIDFTGSAVFVIRAVQRPDGSIRVFTHANTQGFVGIGQTTGAAYRLIESFRVRQTFTHDADTMSRNLVLNVVGDGSVPDYLVHGVVTVHVDFATGEVTEHIRQNRTECR